MFVSQTIVIALISGLLGSLLGACVSFYLNRRYTETAIKRDVLRRFVANRHLLTTHNKSDGGEPFIALNEVFIVYANHSGVISKLKKMQEELGTPERLSDNIVSLIKAMAKAVKVPIGELNDDFLLRPFTPPQSVKSKDTKPD